MKRENWEYLDLVKGLLEDISEGYNIEEAETNGWDLSFFKGAQEYINTLLEQQKVKIKVPTITIKIPLYDYDQDDNIVGFNEEDVADVMDTIRAREDICGYTMTDITVTDEEMSLDRF